MPLNRLVFGKRESAYIKGILIVLMVIHHLFGQASSPAYVDDMVWQFVASFGKICVASYAFLSGYGLCVSSKGRDMQSVVRRVVNLLVRYWICLTLILIADIASGAVSFSVPELLQIAASYGCVFFKYDGNAWFILPYFCFVLLLPLVLRGVDTIKNRYLRSASELLCIAVPIAVSTSSYILLNEVSYFYNLAVYSVLFMLPFFYAGSIFAKYRVLENIPVCKSALLNIGIGVLLLGVVVLLRRVVSYNVYGNNVTDIVLAPMFIVSLLMIINGIRVKWVSRVFCGLGAMSTNIWLIHYVFCQGSLKFLVEWSDYAVVATCIAMALCVVSSFVVDFLYNIVTKGCKHK